MGQRNEARDGLGNRLEFFLLTHFNRLIWGPVQSIAPLRDFVNRLLINHAINEVTPRPYALSTKSPYTSWESLTDRTYSGRHLPPRDLDGLPPVKEVIKLFKRPEGGMQESSKSTILFSYFAQWFTDGFLRSDYRDPLKNTSNHDIDLSNLYGLRPEHAHILRSHVDGKLKSQVPRRRGLPALLLQERRLPTGSGRPRLREVADGDHHAPPGAANGARSPWMRTSLLWGATGSIRRPGSSR